jgi:hypothetical protein
VKLIRTLAVLSATVAMGLHEAASAGADESSTTGATMEISPNSVRPAGPGPAETFTGDVTVKPLFDPNGVRTFGSAEVSFTPCARTATP